MMKVNPQTAKEEKKKQKTKKFSIFLSLMFFSTFKTVENHEKIKCYRHMHFYGCQGFEFRSSHLCI